MSWSVFGNLRFRRKSLIFLKERAATSSPCPICNSRNTRTFLKVPYLGERLAMYKCECGSLFYPGRKAPSYLEVENNDNFWMRVDQSEGLDSIIAPIFLSKALGSLPVVDVGSGMGFGSDFLRYLGRDVVAFDPSTAARISSERLGFPIKNTIAIASDIHFPAPRLAFASEVIEHVDDPKNFMAELRSIAGADGYCIATTPNSEFIQPGSDLEVTFAMLAPSQHLFLLSPWALKNLAESVGFDWASTFIRNDRLFLVAGPRPVNIEFEFDRDKYLEYLSARLSGDSISDEIRYRAFGYRLFKELVHRARYDEAKHIFEEMAVTYGKNGIDLYDPLSVANLIRKGVTNSSRGLNAKKFPFNLGIIFALFATLEVAQNQNRVSAKPYALAALKIGKHYQHIFGSGENFSGYDLEIMKLIPEMKQFFSVHRL